MPASKAFEGLPTADQMTGHQVDASCAADGKLPSEEELNKVKKELEQALKQAA